MQTAEEVCQIMEQVLHEEGERKKEKRETILEGVKQGVAPIIKGGQGRTSDDIERDCSNVAALFLIAVIIFVMEVVL